MFVMGLTPLETIAIWAVFGVALIGLAYAVFLRSQILREDKVRRKCRKSGTRSKMALMLI